MLIVFAAMDDSFEDQVGRKTQIVRGARPMNLEDFDYLLRGPQYSVPLVEAASQVAGQILATQWQSRGPIASTMLRAAPATRQSAMRSRNEPLMRLTEIEIELTDAPLPDAVAELLADAKIRLHEFDAKFQASIPAFVPSDFEPVYRALAWIQDTHLPTGRRFLEWGSGIGAVTCLAALAGFDAIGIEIEPPLVEIAESLAADHAVEAEFACGSYVPAGAESLVDVLGEVTWLRTDGPDSYADLELEPDDFDVIFAYPWPGEDRVIFDLFEHSAAVGALLLTYHSQDGLRLNRKVRRN
jgi:hypothetical protein